MKEWKWSTYEWMKQTLCFLNRAPYLRSHMLSPQFWEVVMSSPRFKGSWHMNEWYEKYYVLYAICYVLCAIWYIWWCMLLSWHDFPNPIWKVHWLSKFKFGRSTDFPNQNLASLLTWLSINYVVRKELLLLMHVIGVCLHILILSIVCTNPI